MTQNTKAEDLQVEISDEIEASEPQTSQTRQVSEGAGDDDLEQYGEKVKKRIGKLVFERNEEQRRRQEAIQLQEEAVRYAEQVFRENANLKKRLGQTETSALAGSKALLDSELAQEKLAFKAAYEAGDADAVTEAQIKIASLTARKAQLESAEVQRAQQVQRPVQTQAPLQTARPTVPTPDPKAQRWAQENDWFGKDEVMTAVAYGVHEKLIRRGIDPRSDEYYSGIDAEVRKRFPERFDTPGQDVVVQPRQTGNVVAPASRDVKTPRTVRLTPSAVALAKRLGLTPEQYAAQVLKDAQNG